MKYSETYRSNYLRAADLAGDTKLTIASVEIMEFEGKEKFVLAFKGEKRGLVLNVTNGNVCQEMFGDDTKAWIGGTVVLYPTRVQFGSELRDAIRIRLTESTVNKLLTPAADNSKGQVLKDDEIPF